MSEQEYPAGWDVERIQRLIAHNAGLTEDEQVAEDEAAFAHGAGLTTIAVPTELLPAIRRLLASYEAARNFP